MRWPWPVAVVASALTGVLVVAGAPLAVLAPTGATIAWATVGGVCAGLSAGLGVVIARRAQPKLIGALLALVGLAVALTAAREIGWRVLERHPGRLPAPGRLGAAPGGNPGWAFAGPAPAL